MKTVLFDFSNVIHSTFHGIMWNNKEIEVFSDEFNQLWYFYIYNRISELISTLQPNELVVCADSPSWRKKAFKYYKANRETDRAKAPFSYERFFEITNDVLVDLRNVFKFKVMKINMAEADDIIAILTEELKDEKSEIIIASNDKDFKQLIGGNVKMFYLNEKEFLSIEDKDDYLIRHILKGDTSDGIPSVPNEDDILISTEMIYTSAFKTWLKNIIKKESIEVNSTKPDEIIDEISGSKLLLDLEGKYNKDTKKEAKAKARQKPCGDKMIDKILTEGLDSYLDENNLRRNYNRNRKLIELSREIIPQKLWNFVIEKYRSIEDEQQNYIELSGYFSRKGIRKFVDSSNEFMLPKTKDNINNTFDDLLADRRKKVYGK